MSEERNEKELLLSAKRGEMWAFEELIRLYERGVFGYLLRLTGDKEDAQDVAQETFLKVFNSISSYDTERPFKAWIYTIATRTLYDWFRKKKVRKELYIIDDEDSGFETIDETDAYKRIDTGHDLEIALKKIKPAYKSVLLLYYMQGFTYEEIAKILSEPLGTVKTNIRRAKIALRDILKETDGGTTTGKIQ